MAKSRMDCLAPNVGWGGVNDSYRPKSGTPENEKLSISHDRIKVWNLYEQRYDYVSSEILEGLAGFDSLAPELKERIKTRVGEVLKLSDDTDSWKKLVNEMVARAKKQGVPNP